MPTRPLTFCILASVLLASALPGDALAQTAPLSEQDHGWNTAVLAAVRAMPSGGSYATNAIAKTQLCAAVRVNPDGLTLTPEAAQPSFCSGATYLVFLRVLNEASRRGGVQLSPAVLTALAVKSQRDGEGIWGRWNANGPGTARLFTELGLGRNFTEYTDARPGDFMKIFWTSEIGKAERGHSVIYLGTETVAGVERVRFWSSNKPLGYGEKSVPKKQVARALFSRLEHPENISRVQNLPKMDKFLADMLTRRSTMAEVERFCGF